MYIRATKCLRGTGPPTFDQNPPVFFTNIGIRVSGCLGGVRASTTRGSTRSCPRSKSDHDEIPVVRAVHRLTISNRAESALNHCGYFTAWLAVSGIFAYLNYLEPKTQREILECLIRGLKRLEYRGYDSSGLAFCGGAKDTQVCDEFFFGD